VAKQIWEQLQIPVVYVTAYADTATLDKIKTTEPYGYVLKPVRPAEVDAAIQLALDRHDRENREP
jgi:AmiR/NasT family two-component response regulator